MKLNYKLAIITILISSILFITSCVSNSDEQPVAPPVPSIPLTIDVLKGEWEICYFTKTVADGAGKNEQVLRSTEYDGFSVQFGDGDEANGYAFQEYNVFGMKTTIDGKYKLGNYENDDAEKIWTEGAKPNLEKNAVFTRVISAATSKDSINRIRIPHMFEERFAWYDIYNGTVHGNRKNVEDIRYFRNKIKAPNYTPFPKYKTVNVADILGTWELYKYYITINNIVTEDGSKYGERITFSIDSRGQIATMLPANSSVPIVGYFKITDDVLNMYFNINGKNKSSKLWIQKSSVTGGRQIIQEYDRYFPIDDDNKIAQDQGLWKKIS